MKWLFPMAFGSVVVALAVSFPRAQDTSSALENPERRANVDDSAPAVAGPGTGDAPDTKREAGGSDSQRGDARSDAGAADPEEVKIFQLKNANATASRDVILELYPAEFRNRSKISADVRTNTLILRGPPELLMLIEAVLMRLDDSEETNRPVRQVRGDFRKSATAGERSTVAGKRTVEIWLEELATAVDPEGDVQRVREDFSRQEQLAAGLAQQYRKMQSAAPADDAALQKLKSQLEVSVKEAFDARQKVQGYELDQLRQRLARIEARLTMRERAELEIIRQRVEQLLHPEREWDSADEPAARPVRSGWKTAAERSLPFNPLTGTDPSVEVPAAATNGVPRKMHKTDVTDYSLKGTTNPRQALLDAEAAIDAARGAVAAAGKTTQLARTNFERKQTMAQNGTIPQQSVHAAEEVVLHEDARLAKARLDLQQAERQAALAREDLNVTIRIKEIDLADAQLRLENATTEESRARALLERKVLAQEEYDQKRLALNQAKLQVERTTTLLDLYRKALPAKSSADDDRRNDKPTSDEKDPFGSATKKEAE